MNLLVSGLITLLFNQLNVVVLLHDQTRQSMINIRKSKILSKNDDIESLGDLFL